MYGWKLVHLSVRQFYVHLQIDQSVFNVYIIIQNKQYLHTLDNELPINASIAKPRQSCSLIYRMLITQLYIAGINLKKNSNKHIREPHNNSPR